MAQIESTAGLERVEELAAIPDVDLFIGPADLAASLGVAGNTSHPSVRAAAARIVKAARDHDKCVATACAPEEFGFWLGLGIDLLYCANDISCLKQAAGDMLADARQALQQVTKNSARVLDETRA
jgi:4-hydroxy-2-oxoheptanedioate aldolase